MNLREPSALTSAEKALLILEYVGLADKRTLAEIAAHTGLPKSTLLRLLNTLVENGFLRRTSHGQYAIALKLWRIGCSAVNYETVRENVIPALHYLVQQTSETALYAVYEDCHSVYVEKVEGLHPVRAYTKIGGRSPAYASATGKALLAWRTQDEIAEVGAQAHRYTKSTLTAIDQIAEHCAEIRRTGFAVNRGEWRESVWGIASPVFGRDGSAVAAVGVSGPRERIEPRVEKFVADVREIAHQLSAQHGGQEYVA